MKTACLLGLEQAAVIVQQPGGVSYWNQHGYGSPRYEMEGILVPVSNDPPADQPALALSVRLQDVTAAGGPLTAAMVRELNELLFEVSSSDELRVDSTRLSASAPGWVHITIKPQGEFSYFAGFVHAEPGESSLQGVLTWPCRR